MFTAQALELSPATNVPDAATPDEAVFLPGRNVLLLAKSLLWCHLNQVSAIALGSLQTNPFPDATPAFFRGMQDLLNQAMQGNVEVRLPFGGMKKVAVMRLGVRHAFRWSIRFLRARAGGRRFIAACCNNMAASVPARLRGNGDA